jgi:hypothetical protein
MRTAIIDQPTTLLAFTKSIVRAARSVEATLERLKTLNPHLADTQKLAAGTVLVIPDSPDVKPGVGEPVGVQTHSLTDFAAGLRTGLRDLAARHKQFAGERAAENAALRDALKAAPAKRLVESDPILKERLAAAETAFKVEQKRIAEVEAQLADTAKQVEAELAKMQKLPV